MSDLVVIESPYSGRVDFNLTYARICLKDALGRDEYPIASHLLYTQVLDDAVRKERDIGIQAGFAWGEQADRVAVYRDFGISKGMRKGIEHYSSCGVQIVFRELGVSEQRVGELKPLDEPCWPVFLGY